MIKVENIEVWGFKHAIRGMRNPMNSWEKSDSEEKDGKFLVGKKDLELMHKLYSASKNGNNAHRKYLRQIFVSMDIVAPLYWWKEFDTYKVGVTANSCSTMHKIHEQILQLDDFSYEHLDDREFDTFCEILHLLNIEIKRYQETHNKEDWWNIIQLLPTSYNQRRTVTMSYENAVNIINQRSNHKLDEWNDFVRVLLFNLPYLVAIRNGVI